MFERIELDEMADGQSLWANETPDLGIYVRATDEWEPGQEEQEILEILTTHGY